MINNHIKSTLLLSIPIIVGQIGQLSMSVADNIMVSRVGTQAVGLGVLRGIMDMKIPTLITLAAYWIIGLPSGYILAFYFKMGIYGV